jgi:hypothetical protein
MEVLTSVNYWIARARRPASAVVAFGVTDPRVKESVHLSNYYLNVLYKYPCPQPYLFPVEAVKDRGL